MWIDLRDWSQLEEALRQPLSDKEKGLVVLKHSTRCSISAMAKSRVERHQSKLSGAAFYLLDLLNYRDISNKLETTTGVTHQSPQLLYFLNGKCIYHASHSEVSIENLLNFLTGNK